MLLQYAATKLDNFSAEDHFVYFVLFDVFYHSPHKQKYLLTQFQRNFTQLLNYFLSLVEKVFYWSFLAQIFL